MAKASKNMKDLKGLTVRYLRELARKHLGRGFSRLRTKEQLVEALMAIVPEQLRARVAARRPAAGPVIPKPVASPAPPAEPVVEGFFVARVAGEDEVYRHHLSERQRPPPIEFPPTTGCADERLGDLRSQGKMSGLVLLPRDPHTLFVMWDDARLSAGRAVLRVFEGSQLVREVECALASRSQYIGGLAANRRYRAELWAIEREGGQIRLAESSRAVALPSAEHDRAAAVRFLRVPWERPLEEQAHLMRAGTAEIQFRERLPQTPGEHWTEGTSPRRAWGPVPAEGEQSGSGRGWSPHHGRLS